MFYLTYIGRELSRRDGRLSPNGEAPTPFGAGNQGR